MPIQLPIKTNDPILCSICNKRPATKLCDFPLYYGRYVGHPPRHLMLQAQRADIAWKNVPMSWTQTCDKPLCDQCAISMNCGIDFCPNHIQEMQARRK